MQTDTVSIAEFIASNRITMTAEQVDENPSMTDGFEGDHWKVVLTRKVLREGFDTFHGYKGKLGAVQYSTRKLTTYFSKGYGHHGAEPTADEVLDCLSSDASCVDNARDFEDFASELGYDSDSRQAEKIFKARKHSAARLEKFLGSGLYQELMYSTERL